MDLQAYIEEQVKNVDINEMANAAVERMVREKIRDVINRQVEQEVRSIVKTRAVALVDAEITRVLSEGMSTDDGFGERKTFVHFEAFFKKSLYAQIKNDYDVRRRVERMIEEQAKKLYKTHISGIMDDIIKQLDLRVTNHVKDAAKG